MANEGLGNIQGQQAPRNTSLEMFDLANAEKMKAKEMQYENEAMRARADQQNLQAEKTAMIDNQILSALKNGQIDEQTAAGIFQDPRISDSTKQAVADVFYPARALKESGIKSISYEDYENDEYAPEPSMPYVTDYKRQSEINARSRGLGRVGAMNMTGGM